MYKILSVTSGLVIAAIMLVAPAKYVNATSQTCLNQSSAAAHITVSGTQATANFKIPNSCGSQQVSLVSYKAPSASGDPLSQQVVFHSNTQNINPGTYKWTIEIPDCFYQVDLVRGEVIQHFTNTETYHNQNRFLAGKNGGTQACVTVVPNPTPAPTPTPTPAPQTPAQPTVLPNTGVGNTFLIGLVIAGAVSLLHFNRHKLLKKV